MNQFDVYDDIAERTNGDIYVGVVGPVRCGKSTFISKFMNLLVLPNITNKYSLERAKDELPQSADGRTVMTTQPKFVPNEAVKIMVKDKVELNVRMIDCVGYLVDGALGVEEGDKPRLVKTPWSEEEMSFEDAAEFGTTKVIEEHSTVAVLLTTDGSFTDIERHNYVEAEERVVQKLNDANKPFVIVLNTSTPNSSETKSLVEELSDKYNAPAMALNVENLSEEDISGIFENMLTQFPLVSVKIKLPTWLEALPFEDALIQEIISEVSGMLDGVKKVGDFKTDNILFVDSEKFEPLVVKHIKMGEGKIIFEVTPKPHLFYTVLSEQCGMQITSDFELISSLKQLTHAKKNYDKLKIALDNVDDVGYGVVYPDNLDMTLDEPKVVRQGNRSGIKLRATAPSLHIMRVDIETEINPIVGNEQQSEDLVNHLLEQYKNNPLSLWETNMFGKSLHQLVKDGIDSKLTAMPQDVQKKMRKTLSRVINEGKGGVICILL